MSTSVYTRIGMAELRNIISAHEELGTTSTPPVNADVNRVCRNLFGPVDHEENRRFIERELAQQQQAASDRWGFDFPSGTPRTSGMGTSRYSWEKVTPNEAVPEPYGLLRMTALQKIAVDDDDQSPKAEATTTTTTATATTSMERKDEGKEDAKEPRQSRITEYMLKRKSYKNGAKTCPPTEPAVGAPRTKKSRTSSTPS